MGILTILGALFQGGFQEKRFQIAPPEDSMWIGYENEIKEQIAQGRKIKTYYARYLQYVRRHEEAEAMFQAAIADQEAEAKLYYGYFLYNHWLCEEAEGIFEEVIASGDNLPLAYYWAGLNQQDMAGEWTEYPERYQAASVYYYEAMERGYLYGLNNYLNMQIKLGHQAEVEKYLDKLLRSAIPDLFKAGVYRRYASHFFYQKASAEELKLYYEYQTYRWSEAKEAEIQALYLEYQRLIYQALKKFPKEKSLKRHKEWADEEIETFKERFAKIREIHRLWYEEGTVTEHYTEEEKKWKAAAKEREANPLPPTYVLKKLDNDPRYRADKSILT